MHLRFLPFLLAVVAGSVIRRADEPPVDKDQDPERYSSCAIIDAGFQLSAAQVVSKAVVDELITTAGKKIRTNYCHYKVLNATIAGVCNGSARNRTVTADEVTRGFNQLAKDCGNDSGYHVVNNLTFSTYGLIGGIKALVPATFEHPDFPGWSDEPEIIPVR